MAFKSLATSGIVNFNKYQNALVGNAAYFPDLSSDFLISEQILASNAASVTFDVSSLAATYKHLQIRYTTRSDASTFPDIRMRFNSDTGTNYAYHRLRGYGSGVDSGYWTSTDQITVGHAAGTTTTQAFYAGVIDILDFASTSKNKTTRTLAGYTANGYDDIRLASGLWASTSAITNIQFLPSASNFAAGTRFSLYGSLG